VTILVTGATGFIGGHLVRRLLAERHSDSIICLVRPSADTHEIAAAENLRQNGIRVIEGDLTNPTVSAEVPPQVDLVFHLAANTDTSATEAQSRVNDLGCQYLLSWLANSAAGARIVYSSSIAVLDRDRPADGPLRETSPCVPRTAYGRTKLRGEQIIREEAERRGYHYTIFRLATVYGPGAKRDGLFDKLYKLAKRHSLLARLNWPGRTSIVHVDDVTAMMIGLSQLPEAANETYCIATAAPTVGALAEQIARFAPEPASPVRLPAWAWAMGRSMAWSRSCQILAATVAQTTLWRLTLMVDDGFWFDTQKLQSVWNHPPKDLVEGLAEMLKYL